MNLKEIAMEKKTYDKCPVHMTSIGGQSVIEGIMMRGPKEIATAVRKSDGSIIIDKKPVNSFVVKYKLNKIYNVGYYLPRVRSNVGVKVRIDKYHSVSLYWRYDYTKSKYLSYELMDAPFGIITKSNTNNFVGIFYTLNL